MFGNKLGTLWVAGLVLMATHGLVGSAEAGKKDAKVERKGVLAGLPSEAGPQLQKVLALGDNEWVNLGSPAPDPKWGHGRGRSWSCKMTYAPELRGAFLAGAGPHAFIKPDGHYDDIFFYDLNAHRWICIFPGVNTKTFGDDAKEGRLKVNDDGQLTDQEGRIIPLAYRSHSGQTHTYDTDQCKWVSNGIPGGIDPDWWSAKVPWYLAGAPHLTGKPDKVAGQLLSFNTITGLFERPAGKKPPVRGGGARGEAFFYLPTKKAYWAYSSDKGTQIGDVATGQWTVAKTKDGPPGTDLGACYDSKRDRIYTSGGTGNKYDKGEGYIYIYDVKTGAWSNPPNKGPAVEIPGSTWGMIHYDTASDKVVVLRLGKGVSTYDPETGEFSEEKPLPKEMRKDNWHGFYSPEVNAHFIYVAIDGRDKGDMWAYRYKRAAK